MTVTYGNALMGLVTVSRLRVGGTRFIRLFPLIAYSAPAIFSAALALSLSLSTD